MYNLRDSVKDMTWKEEAYRNWLLFWQRESHSWEIYTSFLIIHFVISDNQQAYISLFMGVVLMTFVTSFSHDTYGPTW